MKLSDIQSMTNEELSLAERNTAEELWQLRFQHHTGQLTNTASLRATKRRRARILTVLKERSTGISQAPGEEN